MVSTRTDSADAPGAVLYRARVTPTLLAINVVVGIALCAGIGAFLGYFILDKVWPLTILGVLVGFSGFRTRKEPHEILPATIERGGEANTAVCTFYRTPSETWDGAKMAYVDAEATGTAREGFIHWVVLQNKLSPPVITKIRMPNRKQAVTLAHELRELFAVSPRHPLGDDEPGGLALEAPVESVVVAEKAPEKVLVAAAETIDKPSPESVTTPSTDTTAEPPHVAD